MVEQKYEVLTFIGDGSFGQVFRAKDQKTHELVAIKKMKTDFDCWEDAMSLPEVKALL